MKKYFKEWKDQEVNIIYTASNEEYMRGYDMVRDYHPEFNWIKETNFMTDTRNAFNQSTRPYVSFLVDDDVFVNPFSIEDKEFKMFQERSDIICFSSRLHPNVTMCYTMGDKSSPPPTLTADRTWIWRGHEGDWGYPMSVASFHVFRKNDVTLPINSVPFKHPSDFEGLCLVPHTPPGRPRMVCYETGKCICTTNNRVQNFNTNRNDETHTVQELNEVFLTGKRLSPDVNDGLQLQTCHGPVTYEWI
jgi:hypothetical protein